MKGHFLTHCTNKSGKIPRESPKLLRSWNPPNPPLFGRVCDPSSCFTCTKKRPVHHFLREVGFCEVSQWTPAWCSWTRGLHWIKSIISGWWTNKVMIISNESHALFSLCMYIFVCIYICITTRQCNVNMYVYIYITNKWLNIIY